MGVFTLNLKRYLPSVIIMAVVLLFFGMEAQAATISSGVIKAAVTGYVEKTSPWPAGCVRVSFLSKVTDEEFSGSSPSLKVSGRSGEDFIGNTMFTIDFYSENSLLRKRSVTVSVEVLTDVVVSARQLERTRIIKPADLYVQKRWLRNIPANLVSLTEAVGKSLIMTIRANRDITRNMLREQMLVKKGTVVKIEFYNDVLRIAALGMSEEAGCKGEIIRVKNISSNRIIYARVTGGDTVRVDF